MKTEMWTWMRVQFFRFWTALVVLGAYGYFWLNTPESCSMTTRQTKLTKSDNMTEAISADPSPGVVLQALLADDLMAFTEFAFGVVRPGIQFKPNWHLEAVTYKLSQVAKGLVRRLIITVPPRALKSLCALSAYPGGTGE